MSPTLRTILTFIAALLGFIAGYGIEGIPPIIEALIGGIVVAFAAIGIPSQLQDTRTERVKRIARNRERVRRDTDRITGGR